MSAQERVEMTGHIIDSGALTKLMDTIMDLGGDFEVEDQRYGRRKDEPSYIRLEVRAPTPQVLEQILLSCQTLGANLFDHQDVHTELAPKDGALPNGFYSTTNLRTEVRLNGTWVVVDEQEMDLAIVVDSAASTARCLAMADVRAGQTVVVGHHGIRVTPLQRAREREVFSFMRSEVSSERPKHLAIYEIAEAMRRIRAEHGKVLFVVGPAIIHTGAGPHLEQLIRDGYVQVLFGGNAIATHDIESALLGTSLGVDLATGLTVEGGHANHMRALNAVRQAGSIHAAVEQGLLRRGVMYECLTHGVELVLAGSIRDDGPMPEVITDVIEAQKAMRRAIQGGVQMAIMVSTMLHSIATGNLLPATVKTVVVDINPATVTKLADRGSFQVAGIVSDAELFLSSLAAALRSEVPALPASA
ncbi:MAG TPA: TIGR00300 family protein [Chloroflexota bacterium]|nr:TIGR00300 family protein [Chloroflexota bacterium]